MTKQHTPMNLKRFTVVSGNATVSQVKAGFDALLHWMVGQQGAWYTSPEYQQLAGDMAAGVVTPKKPMNHAGRAVGLSPATGTGFQDWNTAEMFRALVMMNMCSRVQTAGIMEAVVSTGTPPKELTAREVREQYKVDNPGVTVPKIDFVANVLRRVCNGNTSINPKSSAVLPLWATDAYYCKVTTNGSQVHLTVKLEGHGLVTLAFQVPKKDRFVLEQDKVTKPTVFRDRKGHLTFSFVIDQDAPEVNPGTATLGVDQGRVTPYVATLTDVDNGTYSAPILPSRTVNGISRQIDRLYLHKKSLRDKERVCRSRGWHTKADVLHTERVRVGEKISRLKVHRARHIATELVEAAAVANATIILENLAWVKNSTWEQAKVSEAVEHKAVRRGVKVKKISPKNTSQKCCECGGKVTHNGRMTTCTVCGNRLDRDILASRNLAAMKKAIYRTLTQLPAHQTCVSGPVTVNRNGVIRWTDHRSTVVACSLHYYGCSAQGQN